MGISGVPIPKGDIIEAIKKAHGKISHAAKKLKCQASTIYARADQDPEIKQVIEDARKCYDAELLDESCDALLELVKNRENNAVFFALKTKGRHLGFDQDQQIIQQMIPFDYKGRMDKAKQNDQSDEGNDSK